MDFVLNKNYLLAVIFFIVASYLLCAIEHYQLLNSQWLSQAVHQQMLSNEESSFFEILSAAAWFIASILFVYLLCVNFKVNRTSPKVPWLAFYCVLAIFAFGEEVSWGDHVFDYSNDMGIVQINAQKETNIHNVDLTMIFDVKEDNVLYHYIKNFGNLATPLFYIVLMFLWGLLPLMKKYGANEQNNILSEMPGASLGLSLFMIIHAGIFVFIDAFLFNVGQIYEMFIGLAAVIVALDILKESRAQTGS